MYKMTINPLHWNQINGSRRNSMIFILILSVQDLKNIRNTGNETIQEIE